MILIKLIPIALLCIVSWFSTIFWISKGHSPEGIALVAVGSTVVLFFYGGALWLITFLANYFVLKFSKSPTNSSINPN